MNKGDVIVTLYYGGGGATKQICQLKPAAIGTEGNLHPMAIEIMTEVGRQFALNKFGDDTKVLFELRDRLMRDRGLIFMKGDKAQTPPAQTETTEDCRRREAAR